MRIIILYFNQNINNLCYTIITNVDNLECKKLDDKRF
jgi:hypothetical protein